MDFPSTSWTGCTTLTKHASCAHAESTPLLTTMGMNALANLSSMMRVKLQGIIRKFFNDIQKFYYRNQWKCNDQPGSCPRLLCECDLMFAQSISDAMDVKQLIVFVNNVFSSTIKPKNTKRMALTRRKVYLKEIDLKEIEHNRRLDCRRADKGGEQRCCGAPDKPMFTYNAQNKQCCGGEIFSIGDFCINASQNIQHCVQHIGTCIPRINFAFWSKIDYL